MAQRYIAFDVETPNSYNDRMSAIGITVIEDNQIVDTIYSLVNPETHFDSFNIDLTGISPEMVNDQPTFAQLWQKIEPIMDSGLLIAHNAPFDMSVLAKCLTAYQIEWHPYTYYACTCAMGRVCYPELGHHKLNTLCDYLDIELTHHNAGSDSEACAKLLIDYLSHGMNPDRFLRTYDLLHCSTQRKSYKTAPSESTLQLLKLKDILADITSDGILSDSEVYALQEWMDGNAALRGNFPFDKIFSVVDSALADGVLAPHELQSMLDLFEQITDPVANSSACGNFDINGKTFCLTGEFNKGSRSMVEDLLTNMGGIPVKSVTKKTDYVIVGSQGSEAWSAGNYGSKIKKALELQEKGVAIQIIKESDLKL